MILASDFDQSLIFYRDILGLDCRLIAEPIRAAWLFGAGRELAIILVEDDTIAQNRIHYASLELWSDDNVDVVMRQLEVAGAKVVARVNNKYKDSVFIESPDGINFEFYKRYTSKIIGTPKIDNKSYNQFNLFSY